ncbi:hypothetical protein ACGFI5_14765 [Micromonospora tulbaghiae]|uniref:hypothetical protein n=1 Tax=Micromonospora tulbaghiae TaxID=479978 RepID=UPI003713C8F7
MSDSEPQDREATLAASLASAVQTGGLFNSDRGPAEPFDAKWWDAGATVVKAETIRDIAIGKLIEKPDPRGLRILGVKIGGRLDLKYLNVAFPLQFWACYFPEGIDLRDAAFADVTLAGCRIECADRSPLMAARTKVDVLRLTKSQITADVEIGAAHLQGAQIGNLIADGIRITNRSGPAVSADGMTVRQEFFLRDGVKISGEGKKGAVHLIGASVGHFELTGDSEIRNLSGPGVIADGIRVGQGLFVKHGAVVTGAGPLAALRLVGAHVGRVELSDSRIFNLSGPALDAGGLRAEQGIFFTDGFEAFGATGAGVVRLDRAKTDGGFVFEASRLINLTDEGALIHVDGLTYPGLPIGQSLSWWLNTLDRSTPNYAAQPYQHLAAAYSAAGHDSEARRTRIAQRKSQIRRGALTERRERVWARFTGLALGYGYQPWRALLSLFLLALIAIGISVFSESAYSHTKSSTESSASSRATSSPNNAYSHTRGSPGSGAPCSALERVGVALDVSIPLIKTNARSSCDLNTTPTGQRLTVVHWVIQVLAWGFATLFVAGFTSVVRKT